MLVAGVGATIASAGFDAEGATVAGEPPQRVATPALDGPVRCPSPHGRRNRITLVSLTDTSPPSPSFAARRGEQVHPDQGMVGIGASNVSTLDEEHSYPGLDPALEHISISGNLQEGAQ